MFTAVYELLLAEMGPSGWWPARSPFEIIVGAILTQNTSWTNVEKALSELRRRRLLTPRAMAAASREELAQAIYSSGYYNQKARKLHEFLEWYGKFGNSPARIRRKYGGDNGAGTRAALREELLGLHGIGPETADSMLCYALEMPYFVVDKYTMRWLERYRPERAIHHYEELREVVEKEFVKKYPGRDRTEYYNEFHALLVRLGNGICTARDPACGRCALRRNCVTGKERRKGVRKKAI